MWNVSDLEVFLYLEHHGESLVNHIKKNGIQNEDKMICWISHLPVLSSGRSGEERSAVAVTVHSVFWNIASLWGTML